MKTYFFLVWFVVTVGYAVKIEVAKPTTTEATETSTTTDPTTTTVNVTTTTVETTTVNATSTTASPTTSTPNVTTPTTTTTAEPKTSTAKPKREHRSKNATLPSMTFLNRRAGNKVKNYFCKCDFEVNVCEINCCCDLDCSKETVKLFDCSAEEISMQEYDYTGGLQSCEISGGLLCIAGTNVKPKTLSFFDSKLQKNLPHWPKLFDTPPDEDRKINDIYEIGEDVLLFNEATELIETLTIPKSVGSRCLALETVQWLRDTSSTCVKSFNEIDNETTTLWTHLNQSKGLIYPVAPGMEYHCASGCLNVSLNVSTGSHHHVYYTIWHNYTHLHGLEVNLTSPLHAKPYTRSRLGFNVKFKAIESKHLFQYPVSGNPGYLPGKPVLVSKRVTFANYTEDEEKRSYVLDFFYFRNGSQPYTANRTMKIAVSATGRCRFTALTFGENQNHRCKLNLPYETSENFTAVCQTYQRRIFEQLIPNFVNATGLTAVYVSEMGNPKNATRHWIKLSPPDIDPVIGRTDDAGGFICGGMIITVGYEFQYAKLLVDRLFDQKVMKEIVMSFGPKVDLQFTKDDSSVPIYTQVQFLDLTSTQ